MNLPLRHLHRIARKVSQTVVLRQLYDRKGEEDVDVYRRHSYLKKSFIRLQGTTTLYFHTFTNTRLFGNGNAPL